MPTIRDDSAGSYGTWNNDDLSWLDLLKANASDGGNALSNLGRNLVDGFSPIGTSEQGNMALQVPPMAQGLADSAVRLFGTPNAPGNMYGLTGVPEFDKPIQDDMTNLQLALYGGNALNPLAKAPAGSVGMFAGRGAKTADHAALARAEEMAGQGIPREQIWNDTGWFKGADDKWRFEIDDSTSRLGPKAIEELTQGYNGDGVGIYGATNRLARGFLQHPAMYDAYPELMNVNVSARQNPKAPYSKGSYKKDWLGENGGRPELTVQANSLDNVRDVALHEFQHGIQYLEGFAPGSSPSAVPQKLVDSERAKLASATEPQGWESVGTSTPDTSDAAIRHALYRNLKGEVEARNVQARKDMTPDERRAMPPWMTDTLRSDTGKPSILGSAMAGAGEKPLSIKAYRGFSGDSPIGGNDLFYSTRSPQLASEYAMQWADETGNPPAVYPIDITFKNPMQIDAQGEPWLSVPFEGRELTARGIAEIAKKRGHDGVHFSNMLDSSEHRVNYDPQDIYVAVQPNTVRSATTGETLFSDHLPSPLGSALATGGEDYDLPEWLRF